MKFNIFELGSFSFKSYVYYPTRGFIAVIFCDFFHKLVTFFISLWLFVTFFDSFSLDSDFFRLVCHFLWDIFTSFWLFYSNLFTFFFWHFFSLVCHLLWLFFTSFWLFCTTTMVIILWKFLMFYQIFLSPQVKRSLIISNKLVYTICLTSCWTT